MGEFDKNKKSGFGFGFGVVVGVVVGATSFLANVSEIVQLFNKEKPSEEKSVAVVEPVEKAVENVVIGKTYVIQNGDDYAEAVQEIIEQEDVCYEEAEETLIQQAYVIDYNEPVFIEDKDVEITFIEQN